MAAKVTDISTYTFNHTMIRIKDPKKSLEFYQTALGMKLVKKSDHSNGKFSLFFLGYDDPSGQGMPINSRQGLLELTHNWGTESDDSFTYHNGNTEPKGFGHICIAVDDLEAACERFESLGVTFKKRPHEGSMHNIAFLLDPDNYWVEVKQKK